MDEPRDVDEMNDVLADAAEALVALIELMGVVEAMIALTAPGPHQGTVGHVLGLDLPALDRLHLCLRQIRWSVSDSHVSQVQVHASAAEVRRLLKTISDVVSEQFPEEADRQKTADGD
jgi:hypothetical protein